nr:hypothetical protein [Bacillus sp. WMMC1349]
MENDPALLLLVKPSNIFELAVPIGIKSKPAYIVVQELEYRATQWADGKPIKDTPLWSENHD